ncbi:MAG: sigma-70 family RNA polymerase sigma factor [Gaiellaceae bacterium]
MTAETDFRVVFSHLGAITNYARRRGSDDADALAAEVMAIAWRRLADVPKDDPRPWLYATARNLLLAEGRRRRRRAAVEAEAVAPAPQVAAIDPQLRSALLQLSPLDREALLLIAWEDLTSTQAAKALGVNATAFRVRLLRARRRLRALLEDSENDVARLAIAHLDAEGS